MLHVLTSLDKKNAPRLKSLSTSIFSNLLDSPNYQEFKVKVLQNESLEELIIDSEANTFGNTISTDFDKWVRSLYEHKLIRYKFNANSFDVLFGNSKLSKITNLSILFNLDCSKELLDDVLKKVITGMSSQLEKLDFQAKCLRHGNHLKLSIGFNFIQNGSFFSDKRSFNIYFVENNITNDNNCFEFNSKLLSNPFFS
jgi:hypothetical protein